MTPPAGDRPGRAPARTDPTGTAGDRSAEQEHRGRAPVVRVVVLNWNAAWYSRRCLDSLRRTRYPAESLQIVLVDNGSVDGSLEQLRHVFPEVRVIANGANLGFAEGCNRAMRDLGGVDHVALVNNDTVVEPGWLAPLVEALEQDPRAGAAAAAMILEPTFAEALLELSGGTAVLRRIEVDGLDVTDRARLEGVRTVAGPGPTSPVHHLEGRARILVPSGPGTPRLTVELEGDGGEATLIARGRVSAAVGRATRLELPLDDSRIELLNGLGTTLDAHQENLDLEFGRPAADLEGRSTHRVPGFCGGAALLRAQMLAEVGVFDPRFFAYYEDADLAWRARNSGWHTVAVPAARVHHALGGSGASRSAGFFFLNHRNWLLTVLRNADPATVRATLRNASARLKYAVQLDVIGRVRRRHRPDLDLVGGWCRVLLGVTAAAPAVLRSRRRRQRFDARRTRVRSRLHVAAPLAPPRPRPGGPLHVYVDVSAARPSDPEHPATRQASRFLGLAVGADPAVDVIPVVAGPGGTGLVRVHPDQLAALLGVERSSVDPDPSVLRLPDPPPRSAVIRLADGPTGDIVTTPGRPIELRCGPDLLDADAVRVLFGRLVEVAAGRPARSG